jgi:predicted nucleotidyltransferase
MAVGTVTSSVDPRIASIALAIRAEIPQAEVRLFGSRARGQARPDSDADLLITVPDAWLAQHNRLQVLGRLSRQLSSYRLPLDLLLYSQSEVEARSSCHQAVSTVACREGILLNG